MLFSPLLPHLPFSRCEIERVYSLLVLISSFSIFHFWFEYFLKVMVSRVVGGYFHKNLVMGMCFLDPVTRCWKKTIFYRQSLEVMTSMAGAIRKVEEPLDKEDGEDIHGKPQMAH